MNRPGLLEKRNTVYGICAVWILLFHIFRYISIPAVPILSNLLRLGNLGVDVFLFLSGMGLCVSVCKHGYSGKAWADFYCRRAARILPPYLIVMVPYYCWAALCQHTGGLMRRLALFFSDLLYITFLVRGIQIVWFVLAIFVFYLLFPILYRFAKKASPLQKVLMLLGVVGFAFLASFPPYLHNLEIVFARLPIFIIGVFYGTESGNRGIEPRLSLLKYIAAALTLLLCGWIVSANLIPSHSDTWLLLRWLVYVPMTLAFLLFVSNFGARSRTFDWIGALSLELYLVHRTALYVLEHYGWIDKLGGWLYLLLPLFSIPAAWLVKRLGTIIRGKRRHNACLFTASLTTIPGTRPRS